MKKNMFKNAISIAAAALLSMASTTVWSQTTTIPTNSTDGWSINNTSTFHINTWSTEGNGDGSGMTTPFLENWVWRSSVLEAGTWSYTLTGLTAYAKYELSALVRAYHEGSTNYPSGVCTYAGDSNSEDISTGNPIYYNYNSGYYKTLTVDGIADANGNLTVGVKVNPTNCNWVAMKNVTYKQLPTFVRVTNLSEITSGAKYLIVYQTGDNATDTGYALDGSQSSSAKIEVAVNNYIISADEKYAFTITGSNSSYSIKGSNNYYLAPTSSNNLYSSNSANSSITEDGNGFIIQYSWSTFNSSGSRYLNYNKDGIYQGSSSAYKTLYLYKEVSLSFPKSEYTANLNEGFTAPTVTKDPSSIGITYTSSNTSVATVNSSTGEVTLKAVGTTVITATYQATKGSVSASYVLRVVSLSFPKSEYTAKLADGFTAPTLTKNPSNIAVTYKSSNTDVATVDTSTGEVTLVSVGSTTITATYKDISASYVLNVTSASSGAIFTKITKLSQIVSGGNYLIVRENGTTGYALDGNSTSSSFATQTVTISNETIETKSAYAFTLTKNGSYYQVQQVGGGQYLNITTADNYSSTATDLTIEEQEGGFLIYRYYYIPYTNYKSCLRYNNGFIANDWWAESLVLYRQVSSEVVDPELTFEFTKGSNQVLIGGTLATTTTKLSSGTVTYSSSDETIATVDANGVVTGVGAGTAVITASLAEDTENGYAAATKTLTVTVNKLTATVTANFSSKTIAVGDQTTLVLTTASTGTKRFQSSNTAIATVDANGVIKGVADGTTTIKYWVDGNNTYNAIEGGSVTITVSTKAKLTPEITVNPSSLTLAIWEVKSLVVDLGSYDGECTATYPGEHGKIISLRDPEKEGNVLTYQITAEAVGEITITLHLEETDNYNAMDIEVPVTVLSVYKYQLNVVNAPAKGVAIEIFGTTYTGTTTFNSSHHPIKVSDVSVRSLASYTSSVTIDDESTITVTYALRYPEKGTFLRLKSYSGNKYATLAADGEALTMSAEGTDNIIYYDEQGRFLFYQNGQFVKATNKMAPVGGTSDASVFTFVHGDPSSNYSECYSVETATGKYLCGSSDGTSEGGSDDNDYAYWYVETIEELPVEITTAGYGYATLFAPVALDLPGGVAAYYVSGKTETNESGNSSVEYKLVLTSLVSLIPANTPTILIGMPGTTYTFPIKYSSTEAKPEDLSNMVGHLEAELTNDLQGSGTVYALQPTKGKETVGFYPWHQTVTSPFKCFFLDPNPNASAAGYRFIFANENSTDLNESLTEPVQDFAVFNILGQRVTESIENLPAGIYLIGGKKVIIK